MKKQFATQKQLNQMLSHYHTNLPHIQPKGAAFFVTFRLEGSIPKAQLTKWESEYNEKLLELKKITYEKERNQALFDFRKRAFAKQDDLLDKIKEGPMYLGKTNIMNIVKTQLHRFDEELYDLLAYSIMSNHVHILVDTIQNLDNPIFESKIYNNHSELSYILKRIKGASASYSNKELTRTGTFWNKKNFDIYIRNDKMLNNVIWYILNNPIKAGIAENWEDYPGNYLKQ